MAAPRGPEPVPSFSPVTSSVALMVTRRCNMSCGHCSVESSPYLKGEPPEADLLDYVRQAAAAGVKTVQITGGEPMLREKVVLRLLRECKQLGISAFMNTNGFWGKGHTEARRRLKALRRAGLNTLTVSYDRYHAEFQSPQAVLHIAQAAKELNFPININIVRVAAEPELPQLIAPFEENASVALRLYDVQPVGRARRLPADSLRSEVEGFCGACFSPAITDDGRVTACNGPSYFMGPQSPLFIGSLRELPLRVLLERHQQDPILDTIRTFGPSRLRDELRQIPGFETFPFREYYHGLCDLCHYLTSNPEAVAALRSRLTQPQFTAERLAARKVIEKSKKGGSLSRGYVSGPGACRLFLKAAWEPKGEWTQEADGILGRADLDWLRQATYLGSCGLARPLLKAVQHPALTRWAPQFFIEHLRAQAIQDGFRELLQRAALQQLAQVLRETGSTGVLLNGAACLALTAEGIPTPSARAEEDLQIYLDPVFASVIQQKLLERGWRGRRDNLPPASHLLASVSYQGVPLRIHTRLMPSFWGLPEEDLLAHAQPVQGMEPYSTLDAEGLILCAGMHTSERLFSYGLKAAWDALWIMKQGSPLDWERLAYWVKRTRIPRGFWIPMRVLSRALVLPFPQEFLRYAPEDIRQQKLEAIARRYLFRAAESPPTLNLFSRRALILLLHDSWIDRGRSLTSWVGEQAAKSPRGICWPVTAQAFRHMPRQLRQVVRHWRQYRRTVITEA